MPFSRRRRRHRRGFARLTKQGLSFRLKTQFTVPEGPVFDTTTGQLSQMLGEIPTAASSTEKGMIEVDVQAEKIVSNSIGTYCFDFTRMLAMTLGNNVNPAAGPYSTVAGLFKEIRFGRGYMKITRVDQGGNAMILSSGASGTLPNRIVGFTNVGTNPIPVRLHYVRMNAHEPPWSKFLMDSRSFMMDPRLRTVTLMPNRSVTFSFTARRFRQPDYLPHTLRDLSHLLANEHDQYRRCEIPGRSSRLGWIPMPLAAYTNFVDYGTTLTPGLGTGLWRIVSPTLAIMFDCHQLGASVIPAAITVEPPTIPVDTSVSNFEVPRIVRQETCNVRVRGIVNTVLAQSSPALPYAGVGKVYTTYPWNQNASLGVTPNVASLFDPPRISSITIGELGGVLGPLYRDSMTVGGFVSTLVPLDTEMALMESASTSDILPIPTAGDKA